MNTAQSDSPWRSNPVFWLIWVLLGAAVAGGLATLAIALGNADRALPEAWHWEGERLDHDFERARVAAARGMQVNFSAAAGECRASVRGAPQDAPTLTALFAHGSDAGLDRVLLMRRIAPGEYQAACPSIPGGRWRVAFEDGNREWSIRGRITDGAAQFTLLARDPEGG